MVLAILTQISNDLTSDWCVTTLPMIYQVLERKIQEIFYFVLKKGRDTISEVF